MTWTTIAYEPFLLKHPDMEAWLLQRQSIAIEILPVWHNEADAGPAAILAHALHSYGRQSGSQPERITRLTVQFVEVYIRV
ncbi:MAG: hypothetical protein ABI076_02230 [Acidobacteriaceae bacterium]